jgi:hypothetical protein
MHPTKATDYAFSGSYGLTKIEYFASLVMQGLLAQGSYSIADGYESAMADESVRLAKALIDKLNGEQQDPEAPEIKTMYRGIGRSGLPLEY